MSDVISKGVFGTVYLQNNTAIKKYTNGIPNQFINEVSILKYLSHPNIVTLLNVQLSDDGVPSIVMEYCDRSLDISIESQLKTEQKIDMMHQLLSALNYIHTHGLIHNDIKDANILVKDKIYKFCDFGSSADENYSLYIHKTTIWWNSPEAIKNENRPEMSKHDIWSLGIVFLSVIVGYQIITGDTNEEVESQHQKLCDVIFDKLFGPLINSMLDLNQFSRYSTDKLLKLDIFKYSSSINTIKHKIQLEDIMISKSYKDFRHIVYEQPECKIIKQIVIRVMDNFVNAKNYTDEQLFKYMKEIFIIVHYLLNDEPKEAGDFVMQFEILKSLDFNIYRFIKLQ
jgi:serine/threonine protein kinase